MMESKQKLMSNYSSKLVDYALINNCVRYFECFHFVHTAAVWSYIAQCMTENDTFFEKYPYMCWYFKKYCLANIAKLLSRRTHDDLTNTVNRYEKQFKEETRKCLCLFMAKDVYQIVDFYAEL